MQSRREFLKTSALIGAATMGVSAVSNSKLKAASPESAAPAEHMGVLVDSTLCIGCRKCEWACKGAHGLPQGDFDSYEDRSVFKKMRRPDDTALTIVNEYKPNNLGDPDFDVKIQCMHCEHPACVSACIVGALSKEENGAVIWDTDKCIGCRYCMVACPFQVPAFEYQKALDPKIMKCDFCFDRQKEGKLPACVEICPVEALVFGKRVDLLEEAHRRLKNYPDKYFNHVYGEYEVGGTSWLYIGSENLSGKVFPKLGTETAPGVTESIQHGLFAYFVPPVALYALLGGIMYLTKKNEEED
ncbi:MAG: 4Fe-4S dicluster domain-containing protein [Chlorobi bacterium]|nr:4Fe-4S dicluster domain-containing protein [Chlorobiota bacterium]